MGGGEAFAEKVLLSMHSGQSDDMGLEFQGRVSFKSTSGSLYKYDSYLHARILEKLSNGGLCLAACDYGIRTIRGLCNLCIPIYQTYIYEEQGAYNHRF